MSNNILEIMETIIYLEIMETIMSKVCGKLKHVQSVAVTWQLAYN
jgi:hypothetical protein